MNNGGRNKRHIPYLHEGQWTITFKYRMPLLPLPMDKGNCADKSYEVCVD